ncbi:methylmalonate semialdehyde dehydrogenase [acylating] 1 [Arthrobacter sp. Hiyo1]|nr:methylmalonate semialdehyde dehydrogenase [acylating] 1 [Arthrobacter sp. Hiyo1]
MVRELSHYIDGQRVDGTSTRFGDVYNPCTGEVQARLPLASADEVRNAIASAEKGQLEWGAMNPQRRGRILLKFVDLVNEHMDELATLLSSEHGKTFPDAKGDIQRGIEVVEFAAGAPHLLKGEFSDNAGTGIDVHSLRQPLGVVAGITPFNFPAMIPLWKSGPALAAGNASSSSLRSATLRCRCAWRNFSPRRGCRTASSTSSTATRKPWIPSSRIRG